MEVESPLTDSHIPPPWGLGVEGEWVKVEGIGMGARKSCKNVFGQRGGRAGLRGLRPGFLTQFHLQLAGCGRLGKPSPISETHFIQKDKGRELYLRSPSFCHLL